MAIAIAISALNALTLSPALCAILLKPHGRGIPAGAVVAETSDTLRGKFDDLFAVAEKLQRAYSLEQRPLLPSQDFVLVAQVLDAFSDGILVVGPDQLGLSCRDFCGDISLALGYTVVLRPEKIGHLIQRLYRLTDSISGPGMSRPFVPEPGSMDLGEKTCTILNSFLGLSHGLSMGYYSP